MLNALVVNAADLLRRPGSQRSIDVHPTLAELLIVDDQRFAPGTVADVVLRLESLSDGVVVDGRITAAWHGTCRRCLTPANGTLDSEVHELYQHVLTDPEAFQIVGDHLDLQPMVREILELDAPLTPLCRADCAGLCPTCGIDRNCATCECAIVSTEHRWAALEDLHGLLPWGD